MLWEIWSLYSCKQVVFIPRFNNLSVMLILTSTKPMTFQIYSLGKATAVNINLLSVALRAHLVFVLTVAWSVFIAANIRYITKWLADVTEEFDVNGGHLLLRSQPRKNGKQLDNYISFAHTNPTKFIDLFFSSGKYLAERLPKWAWIFPVRQQPD